MLVDFRTRDLETSGGCNRMGFSVQFGSDGVFRGRYFDRIHLARNFEQWT